MKDMFLKKNLWLILVNFKLRDRRLHTTQSSDSQGFTLIELLVVIIIVGLLAAIALPAFLGQSQKARFAEAKSFMGTISRGQQAYYLEYREFARDLDELGIGVGLTSASYDYSILTGSITGSATPVQITSIITNVATPKGDVLRVFSSVQGLISSGKVDAIFCTANLSGAAQVARGRMNADSSGIECPANYTAEIK